MKKTIFYIKMCRRNGHSFFLCDDGTNTPQVYYNINDAKAVAQEAHRRLISKKNTSPAAIERVWVFQTVRNVPDAS